MRAVVVHGVEIPEKLLAEEAQNHPSLSAAEAWAAAGHALATKALLLHRAAELGLEPQPERDEEGGEETAEAALVRAVLDLEVDPMRPTEAEVRRVYDVQRAHIRSSPLYEAAHILVEPRSESTADVESARRIAEALADALASRPQAFAELARQYSACPSAGLGGGLGQLRPGDLVAEIEAALVALEPGAIAAAPVRSRFGWHILKLERWIDGRDLPLEAVAPAIREQLERRAWQAAASRYVLGLAEAAQAKGLAVSLGEDGVVSRGSACLGDFLGDGAAADRLVPWLEAADGELASRLDEAATAAGAPAAEFVRAAAAAFVAEADDERWTQLISAAQGADDPALAALAAILRGKIVPSKRNFTVIDRRTANAIG